ncbi:MAG: hypothetical protein KDA42_18175, partial [Planctomycetales bacterium]|nr:hypothetical protein [Planctomycetales bacterium]
KGVTVAVATLIFTAIGVIFTIGSSFFNPDAPQTAEAGPAPEAPLHAAVFTAFVHDENNRARVDVFIVTNDARAFYPDQRGMVQLPTKYLETAIDVYDKSSSTRLASQRLVSAQNAGLVSVRVPRNPEATNE